MSSENCFTALPRNPNAFLRNASLEKSPTKTITAQTNHFFASLCGSIKLELLKDSTFTLKQFNPISIAA